MAAEYIPEIKPGSITPETIGGQDKRTTGTLDEIQFTDMAACSTGISNLLNYKKSLLQQVHLKGFINSRPETAIPNTIFFIREEL